MIMKTREREKKSSVLGARDRNANNGASLAEVPPPAAAPAPGARRAAPRGGSASGSGAHRPAQRGPSAPRLHPLTQEPISSPEARQRCAVFFPTAVFFFFFSFPESEATGCNYYIAFLSRIANGERLIGSLCGHRLPGLCQSRAAQRRLRSRDWRPSTRRFF